jgi:hypothetical protein
VGHVTYMEELKNPYNILVKNLKGKDHLTYMGGLYSVRMWTGFIWFSMETSAHTCEHSNELYGSIKGLRSGIDQIIKYCSH